MENYVGNLDPIRVFHNRWTSRLPIVGTVCAIDIRGFGNPGLDREIGSGNRAARHSTHQIFDVTNPKKVGGSTTGPAPSNRSGGGREAESKSSRQNQGIRLADAGRYVAADLYSPTDTTVDGEERSFCRRVMASCQDSGDT